MTWVVIDSGQTSIGARWWTLRRGTTTTAHVFELPRGEGTRVIFTDGGAADERGARAIAQDLRAEANAARCYATVCEKIADLVEAGETRAARPVGVSGGSLEIHGADAFFTMRPYFGEALLSFPLLDVR